MNLAIVQARMSSTRLPGKVLKSIVGRPMISLQLERIKRARHIDEIVVATSTDRADDAIQAQCHRDDVSCSRGDLNDVLDRFYQAAKPLNSKCIVRLTADCPLIDPSVIDECIELFNSGDYDYASNTVERTYPRGLDVEAFTFAALERAWREARLPSEREHVTPYLYHHPQLFRIGYLKDKRDLSSLRWTVDYPDDFEVITAIYESLYPAHSKFSIADILEFLENHPELKAKNSKHESGDQSFNMKGRSPRQRK